MKSVKKVVLSSVAVGLLISQLQGYEVYKDEEKKISVDVYGSIRGYVGDGTNLGNGQANSGDSRLIFGLQTSSRLGVAAKVGNISATIELGAAEPTLDDSTGDELGIRQLWGAYSFGKAGKLTFGKKDTPSLAKGFSSDIFDNDNGATGFGSIRTSNRKAQIEYSIAGAQIALVQDDFYSGSAKYGYLPRLSLAYSGKGDSFEYKIGGSAKMIEGGDDVIANNASRFRGKMGGAGHLFGGFKMNMLDKKLYISLQAHAGVNADIYGEQRINVNTGGYGFANTRITRNLPYNILIAGGLLEAGFKVGNLGTLIAAFGYQIATALDTPNGVNLSLNGMSAMVQLPMKFGKFTLTPQVSYYGAFNGGNAGFGSVANNGSQSGLMAFMQARFDF